MEDIYFKAFDKYGAALATLYPSQLIALQYALEMYATTGKMAQIPDSFTRLAFMMIVCDLRSQERKETA